MAKIYLVRHCESEGNACRRTQAHVDALVTRKGYEQNEMLRRRFKGIHIDALYSSDSYRSIATVDPIAKERGLPIHVRISLREITTGVWEDQSWGNIADMWPEENRIWSEEPWAMKTPGASSFQQVADRLLYGLRQIAKEIGESGVAVAVSHSCTIKAGLCTILGRPMTDVKEMGHGDNTSISLLDIDRKGNITVEFMNDASHLPDRLKRAWNGVAGADVNMAIYPVAASEQKRDLLRLACADAAQRGEKFDEESYLREAESCLEKHPDYIALSYLKGEVSGYVRMGMDEDLPAACGVLERMYVIERLQGVGHCDQLMGYATHVLRYENKTHVAVHRDLSLEEERVVGHFTYETMKGHPDYRAMYLYCPPCPYPIMA